MREFKFILSVISLACCSILYAQPAPVEPFLPTNQIKITKSIVPETLFNSTLYGFEKSSSNLRKTNEFENLESLVDSIVLLKLNKEKIKVTYVYDSKERIISETTLKWLNNDWIPINRISKNYDAFDNLVFQLEESYEAGKWKNLTKIEKKYNSSNKKTFEAYYTWKNTWHEKRSTYIEYDARGNLKTYQFRQPSSDENWKYEYFYDESDQNIQILYYFYINGKFEYVRKWEYDYTSDYYSVINKYFIWENGNWIVDIISSQIIDENEEIIEEKFEVYNNNEIQDTYLHIREYLNNQILSSRSYKLIENIRDLYRKVDYFYDQYNNLALSIRENYENAKMIDGAKHTNEYNSNNQIILSKYEKWNGSEWKPQYITTQKYNEYQNEIIYFSEHYNNESNSIESYEVLSFYDLQQNQIEITNRSFVNGTIIRGDKAKFGYDSQNRIIAARNFTWDNNKFVLKDGENYKIPYYYTFDFLYSEAYVYYKDSDQIVRSDQQIKANYSISQNFPNPFNPNTTISFSNSKQTNISINLYNGLGQKIKTLENKEYLVGTHYLEVSSSGLASGTYFYQIEADEYAETKKMIILK